MASVKSFTITDKGDIIFAMKTNRVLKTAVAALCAVALMPVSQVFAAADTGNATYYPDDFGRTLTFEGGLTDYAVHGDTFAFATGSTIHFLSDNGDDTTHDENTFGSVLNRIDYSGEDLFVEYLSGTTCKYPDKSTPVEHAFQNGRTVQVTESVLYTITEDSNLSYIVLGESNTLIGSGYKNVKTYDGKVYAVKDDLLYVFDSATPEPIDLTYTSFAEDAKNIKTGDAAANLKKSDYVVKTAYIGSGKYYSRINPDKLGENFTFEPSEKLSTKKSTDKLPCLVLCETGNASIVAVNGECYLTATTSLEEGKEYPDLPNEWGDSLAYSVETTGIYSRPYMCESTKRGTLPAGSENGVTVVGNFTDFFDNVYYKVTYGEGENAVTGFVFSRFLTKYTFPSEGVTENEKGDGKENFKYDTNVVSVVLTVVIIALVLIAVFYLYFSYRKKSKKRKQEQEKEQEKE